MIGISYRVWEQLKVKSSISYAKSTAYKRVKNHGWRNITSRLWFVRQVLGWTDISRFYAALCNLAYYMIRNDQIALIFNLYVCPINHKAFMSLFTKEQSANTFRLVDFAHIYDDFWFSSWKVLPHSTLEIHCSCLN